ncbi:MAG TPA: SRPBCC family protein [Actinomycetota bacterium]|jgi:uncharacterized protein YndB with AHSA1/START domain|nr:SRPBCC family protein [Actinomycetota bacterium]
MVRRIVVEMGRIVPAPPEVVWSLITDWEHQDDWMLEARDFEVVGEQREGVGVVAEATIAIGGIKTRDRVQVTAWDPPDRLRIAHLGWVTGEGEIKLTRLGAGRTYVYWRETLHPPLGVLGAAGMTLLKPVMARVFRRDLRVLEGLARAAGKRGGAEKRPTGPDIRPTATEGTTE